MIKSADGTIYTEGPDLKCQEFRISVPDGGWRRVYPPEYLYKIRPIAETLAMIDGDDRYPAQIANWQMWIAEADAVYRKYNRPVTSWTIINDIADEDPVIKDALDKLKALLKLKGYDDL